MTGWIAFGVMLVIAAVLAMALKRKSDAELLSLREAQRSELEELRTSATERVSRLERESLRAKGSLRDGVVKDLLPAIDSLQVARAGVTDPEVARGLDLVIREFERGLARHGIEPVKPEPGDAFEPALHEAVETFEDPAIPPGTVGRCHRVGWTSKEVPLRAALVGVVRESASPEEE